MKKIKLNTAKLQLNKERILSLSNDESEKVQGGTSQSVIIAASTYTRTVQPAPAPVPEPITLQPNMACANVSVALKCY